MNADGRKELNPDQRQAVEADNGPVLIVAGPGTGKTKTLVGRIMYLLEQNVPAERILALTFTNKAARELKERLPTHTPGPQITTFHALCLQLLSQHRGKTPELIPNDERDQLIRVLKKSRDLKGTNIRELSLLISVLKNQTELPKDEDQRVLLAAYQEELALRDLSDFDDLLHDLYDILKKQKRPFRNQYQAILVDEFQDTNNLQYELLKLLNTTDNIFVIGDPLQSIYGFRGASSAVFERFTNDWPHALNTTLHTNYRSRPDIVSLSSHVFPAITKLTAHRPEKGQVRCIQVLNEYSEAHWIINTIEQQIGGSTMLRGSDHHTSEQKAHSFRDFAVLYRTHRTASALRRSLDESGLPYQVAGEGSPYAEANVKAVIDELRQSGLGTSQSLSQLITRKVENLGFDSNSPNLRMFINAAVRFDNEGLEAYLNHLDLIADQEFYDPAADAITLLTIHAAKGLEFKYVFLIGVEDGILPHRPAHREPDLEEERRLFYVAVTRARDSLDILHTKKRDGKPATLSPFVTHLPAAVLPRIIDPDMVVQQKRLRQRTIKRSQTTLF